MNTELFGELHEQEEYGLFGKEHQRQQCAIHDVTLCTFCEKEIIETELTYTEDAEPSHIKCLENFNKHWENRNETIDLMGY